MGKLEVKQNLLNENQTILARRVYVVQAKDELLEYLRRIAEPQSVDVFREATVIMTDEVDFERHLEGWGKGVKEVAKETFIESLFGEFCPFENEYELYDVLGTQSYVKLFDRWFDIDEVEYIEIKKDWKRQRTEQCK